MRPGAGLSTSGSAAPPPAPAARSGVPHSAWHSPVPYLFGGLAAMLGLIAFALLILACSYWKLSGYLDSGDDAEGGGSAGGDPAEGAAGGSSKPTRLFEESIVVIMAGDFKPTFLATPTAASGATASFAARMEEAGDAMSAGGKKTESTVSSPRGGEATRSQGHGLELEPQNFEQ